MTAELIFITGATGYIGSATALAAVKAGYRLRISVRRESQIEKVKSILAEYLHQIEFVVIPDIAAEDAFTGKLDGVDYVLHIASPVALHGTNKDTYFIPAKQGTTRVLEAAAQVPSIKKVVITSSVAALIPMGGIPTDGVIKEDNDWDFSVDENADFTGANDGMTAFTLYHASKLLANKATWDFRETKKPHFAIVTTHPVYVYGTSLIQTTAAELTNANGLLWNTFKTNTVLPEQPIVATVNMVNVRDVAVAHVRALDPRIPDGSKYFLAGEPTSWAHIAGVLKKHYPNEPFKLAADFPGRSWNGDTSRAEKELGMQWISVEDTVREVVDQNL